MSQPSSTIPPTINITTQTNPEEMPDNLWSLLGWILGWFIYAYLWLAGADITIFFIRSSYSFESTLFHAMWLLIYPLVWVVGELYAIGYTFVYCPVSHAWHQIMNISFNPFHYITPKITPPPSFKQWIWPWAKTTPAVENAEEDYEEYEADYDTEYAAYCGPNKKQSCAGYNKTMGHVSDVFSQGYWLCRNSPEQQIRNCSGGGKACSPALMVRRNL